MNRLCWRAVLASVLIGNVVHAAEAPQIPRIIPPPGIEIPAEEIDHIKAELARTEQRLTPPSSRTKDSLVQLLPDIEVYVKAVRYAVDHGEFYDAKDTGRALDLLKTANERLDQLKENPGAWGKRTGLLVRGYRSILDGSVQPYGLVIPEKLDLSKPVPLYVWLHGRGDKTTDLQFIHQREHSVGQISPPDAIVLHPFGRYCNAFKFAGEVDVFEAIESVKSRYPIDSGRIVLWGFSMGGAGTWHLAAHYPDRFVAASCGAGFVDTARYQRIDPQSVPDYERKLWGLYDVPGYVRNLFNLPMIAYSGELDPQRKAAEIMEATYAEHGKQLPHLIGAGMGHKYHPEVLADIAQRMRDLVAKERDLEPKSITLQTRTLRYNKCDWLEITGLKEHWVEGRVDAEVMGDRVVIKTQNVTGLRVLFPRSGLFTRKRLEIDGVLGSPISPGAAARVWGLSPDDRAICKRHGLQGPIDDVWMSPFLVVVPSGKSKQPQVEKWTHDEIAHFQDRWRRLFRGDLRIKKDDEVTREDRLRYNLVLWGDRSSNKLIERVFDAIRLPPVQWSESGITVGDRSFPAADHVLTMIYPNLENPERYVVLNSGPTFREAHDRSNSLQTPKLPDWAVIDLSQPPDDKAPGKIAAAGFFDESWQLKGRE